MMGFGMYWGWLLFILFWLAVIGGGIWLGSLQAGQKKDGASAREILDQRYARGELSREDYERMKADLV